MFKNGPRAILFLIACCFLFISFPPGISAVDYHTAVEKYKLPNGLTVILEEDHSIPLVNLQVWIRVGSVHEGKFMGSGISHLVEHMAYKGSATYGADELSQQLQVLGGQLNGATSKEYTKYGITVPKENLKEVMELVCHILTQAEFREEELVKEKDVIIHEMASLEDNPKKYLAHRFWNLAFQGHPYGEPVIGNKLIFDGISRDNLLEYYKSKYIPQNMVLVIVGDFESHSLKPVIEKIWGSGIPAKPLGPSLIPLKVAVQGPTKEITSRAVSKPYIILGFYGPPVDSPDVYPMDVLAQIIGDGSEGRLIKKLRDRLGLVSSITAWSYTPSFTGIWGVEADLVISRWRRVLKHILKELYRSRHTRVTEKELTRAKKQIIRKCLSALEDIEGKAADLGSSEIYTRNPLFTRTYINGITHVKIEDIQRVAKKYFQRQFFTLCILQPKQEEKPPKRVLPEKEPAITRVILDNGLRLLIKEDHSLPLATIRLVALGGLLEENKPGLSYFFSELWLRANPDLMKDIEECGGRTSTYSGYNSLGCTIEVLKEDVPLALRTLREFIRRLPTSKRNVEVTRKIQLAKIKQEEDRPYSYSFKFTKGIFFGKSHPYRSSLLGTQESVSKITEEDILDFKNKHLVPENIVLAIFGDINTSQLIPSVKRIFEDLPVSKFSPTKDFPLIPGETNKQREFKDTEDTIIILAYPGVAIDSGDRYSMEILEQLFSGLAGRLFRSVREERALSYSVGALNFVGREPGAFMFYIATDASGIDESLQILRGEISKIKEEGISEEELQRIKTHLLTQLQEQLETNSGFSLEVALDELYGLGWDYYLKHIEEIKKVTSEDIKRVANKYFRDDWYTLTIVGPIDELEH